MREYQKIEKQRIMNKDEFIKSLVAEISNKLNGGFVEYCKCEGENTICVCSNKEDSQFAYAMPTDGLYAKYLLNMIHQPSFGEREKIASNKISDSVISDLVGFHMQLKCTKYSK